VTTDANTRRHQSGAALLTAVLLLALMGMIGLSSLGTVMRDRQVAGYSSQAQSALYAADAGIAHGLELLRTEVVGAALSAGDCLTSTLPNTPVTSLPNGSTYGPDTTAGSNQICMLATSNPCAELDSSIEQGQPLYLYTVWNVRTEGVSPGGATARVHATAQRCHVFNN
jgi:Tfp pilus assembly protein PilX